MGKRHIRSETGPGGSVLGSLGGVHKKGQERKEAAFNSKRTGGGMGKIRKFELRSNERDVGQGVGKIAQENSYRGYQSWGSGLERGGGGRGRTRPGAKKGELK